MSEPRRIVPFDGPIDADVDLPGSKSVSNRVLLAAALSEGASSISGLLRADDTDAMIGAIGAFGATVTVLGDTVLGDTVLGDTVEVAGGGPPACRGLALLVRR